MRSKHRSSKKGAKPTTDEDDFGFESEDEDNEVVYDSVEDLVPLEELTHRLNRVFEGLKKDLSVIRGGRIDPAMFDHLTVHLYGQDVPLNTVVQVTVKGPQLLVLTCYDPATSPAVDKAVRNSGMNLNPQADGSKITVPIPKMSQETRENMLKIANKSTEKAKIHMKGIRHKLIDRVKAHKDSFSADDVHRHYKEVDKITIKMEKACSDLLEKKKKELL